MIRFIGNNPDGFPQKRSQSLRACERCRKRKKRCTHDTVVEDCSRPASVISATTAPTLISHQQSLSESRHRIGSSSTEEALASAAFASSCGDVNKDAQSDGESDGGNEDRFIGDLNPESIFFAATSPQTALSPGDDHVGIWIPRKALQRFRRRLSSNTTSQSASPDPLFSNILLPYIQRQCQQLLPPAAGYAALYRIYLQEVHPLFPVIDLENPDLNTVDKSSNALVIKQAICLAASASPRGKDHLQLHGRNSEFVESDPSNFASQLASAIRTSVDMGFAKDRVVVVQALTILALFTQFSHQSNISAEVTARAISHAQTLGLHLDVPSTRKNHVYLARLFCCVWVIDKLNAAFQGRPTMLHEHDFGRDLKKTISKQEGCFRLLLNVTSFLDAAISLHRPAGGSSKAAMNDIISFEDLIHECDAVRVSSSLLATIELLYHAVTMLSCRSKVSIQDSSPPQIRETMSAGSIVSIAGTEFQEQISHMPFAPYALSLSLRVFYRELRFSSKSPFTRNRARKQLLNACRLLRDLFAETFPSAMKVAELAEQTVKEMEKVYNNILQQYSGSRSNSETIDHNDHNPPFDAAEVMQAPADPISIPFNSGAFESLPDLDVFEFFDSEFHLDEIDAALVGNMAPPFPYMVDDQSFIQDI